MRRRAMTVLTIIVFVGFFLLVTRLFALQFFQGDFLRKMASEQQMSDIKISAQRGTIYARNMKPLAQSATTWNVIFEPDCINSENVDKICSGMSEILDIDKEDLLKLATKKSRYAVVKKKVESDVKDRIIEFKLKNHI